ncbi:MAG: NAD-dependent deacylase [Flavobacteriales bacterium]|nr:NAD-dependent deacylase [Flavobacteriales bacterium]MDW8431150.1 Sir2 family NAD-dependent protein deacetylase [Flavobacteriales bacterium]
MPQRKNLVVLSGAGISAESGLKTFRGAGGLWEGHRVEDVATPEAWRRDPERVLRFYNERRSQLALAKPNTAHFLLAELEQWLNVHIVTQNVDDLHERAGSRQVLHLHGLLTQVRSEKNENLILDWGYKELHLGDLAPDGAQLRPHVVWFGEMVPAMAKAAALAQKADFFLIVGTSLQVYPAAGLIASVPRHVPVWYIDPEPAPIYEQHTIHVIKAPASEGLRIFSQHIIDRQGPHEKF